MYYAETIEVALCDSRYFNVPESVYLPKLLTIMQLACNVFSFESTVSPNICSHSHTDYSIVIGQ